jgi:exopolysaccharide biosynthesis polyprenyl glycosylphosphotransferase
MRATTASIPDDLSSPENTFANSPGLAVAAPPLVDAQAPAPERDRSIYHPRERAYRLSSLLLMGDWVLAFCSIFVALNFREWQRDGTEEFFRSYSNSALTLFAWSGLSALFYSWILLTFKTYEVNNLYRMQLWTKNHLKAVVLWSVVAWACVGLFRMEEFSPRVGIVYSMVTLTGVLMLWRLFSFVFLIHPGVKDSVSSRVLIVGWNRNAAHLRNAMKGDLAQLNEIIGCVPMPGGTFAQTPPSELAILGEYRDLPKIIRDCRIDSVILADVSCPSSEIQRLVGYCQRELLVFQMVPEYFPALNSGLQVQTVSGVPLLGVSQLPLDRTLNRVLKRGIDIAGALVGLLISSLIVPWFCMIVYLESPGPVIYRQKRTSRSGRTFFIYKIRSMRLDAESKSGAVWCKAQDNRRLKIGTFMRKTNIDELPQFWNVLKGDMSLVGPRPERPELIAKFKNEIPNYNARHEVRAGLTGWAQIKGLRGDTDLGQRIEADLYYLENWSVFLDLYCIVATFFKIKNAH